MTRPSDQERRDAENALIELEYKLKFMIVERQNMEIHLAELNDRIEVHKEVMNEMRRILDK